MPPKEELATLYDGHYYENIKTEYVRIVDEDQDHIDMSAQSKMKVCLDILPPSDGRRRRIPDVGASFGQFLKTFAQKGWRAVKVEPSSYAAEIAQKTNNQESHNNLL